jgi:hypothetical protein
VKSRGGVLPPVELKIEKGELRIGNADKKNDQKNNGEISEPGA